METCLSWHPRINQLHGNCTAALHRRWFKAANVKANSKLWLSEQLNLCPAMSESQPTWLFFGHTRTHCLSAWNIRACVLEFAHISGILHVSQQPPIFSKNKHMPFKEANYVALTVFGTNPAQSGRGRNHLKPTAKEWGGGGWLCSLTLVVKCLTCLCWVGTDRPETKPGLAGQEKGPYSMPVPEWMYCLTSHTHSLGFAIMSRCVSEFFLLAAYIVVGAAALRMTGILVLFKMGWRGKKRIMSSSDRQKEWKQKNKEGGIRLY